MQELDNPSGLQPRTPATDGHASLASSDQAASLRVSQSDLPVFCPNPRMPLWSSHPKVFLELNDEGVAKCPYCGTRYQLQEATD
jgi:uncharacterized Zn-finger protein